ncbi:MAG: hypothetical protein WC413_00875 [Candidatus Nanoarchaeia archaeon]
MEAKNKLDLKRLIEKSLSLIPEPVFKQIFEVKVMKNTLETLQDYIYVPSVKLWVAKEKSLFNLDWGKQQKQLKKQNLGMLTPKQFLEFIKYLKTDYQEINKQGAIKILDEILKVRDPFRAENLDAYFERRKNGLYILTENKTKSELLDKSTLMKDKDPGINLDSLLQLANKQGLPTKRTKKGEFCYNHPINYGVAGFYACFARAILVCDRYHGYSDPALGVRAKKIPEFNYNNSDIKQILNKYTQKLLGTERVLLKELTK